MSRRGMQHTPADTATKYGFTIESLRDAFECLQEQGSAVALSPNVYAGVQEVREKRRLEEEARREARQADSRFTTARELLISGKTIREIEKTMGLPRGTLHRWVREGFLNTEEETL